MWNVVFQALCFPGGSSHEPSLLQVRFELHAHGDKTDAGAHENHGPDLEITGDFEEPNGKLHGGEEDSQPEQETVQQHHTGPRDRRPQDQCRHIRQPDGRPHAHGHVGGPS